jgi:ribose transport system permease protein
MRGYEMKKNKFRDFIANQGIIIVFAILLVIVGALEPKILTYHNIISIFTNASLLGIIAIGMTYVIIGGNFDISVGSFISFGNILPLMILYELGPGSEFVAIIITICAGLVFGCINGILVGYLKINSFMATLSMLSILSGISEFVWSGTRYANILSTEGTFFSAIGRGMVGGIIPVPAIIFLVTAVIFGIILSKTVLGRHIYAVGGNKHAARFAGIREKRVILSSYIFLGLVTGIAAVVWGARYMDISTQQGKGIEMTVIAGVILGGASLLGGTGSVFRTVIGLILIAFINNAVVALGFPFYYQYIATWFCLIAAVWFEVATKRRMQS